MRTLLISAISCLFACCGMSGLRASEDALADADQVMTLIQQAEAVRLQASQAGAEWLRTGQLIGEARREAASGNRKQAEEIARTAIRQSELALEQAAREEQAWRGRVIR